MINAVMQPSTKNKERVESEQLKKLVLRGTGDASYDSGVHCRIGCSLPVFSQAWWYVAVLFSGGVA